MRNLNDHAFIFDIDGTLIDLRQIWEQTYNFLYQKKHGFTLTEAEMKSMFGPPELECHTNILQGRKLYTPERAQVLVDETEKVMRLTLARTDVPRYILPGVIPCLLELRRQKAAVACATGNIESVAKAILTYSGLQEYFPVVAYSSTEHSERHQIVAQAKSELEKLQGTSFSSSKTYVIGDSLSDVRAANQLGFHSIAVPTGHYTRDELQRENPTRLLSTLADLVQRI